MIADFKEGGQLMSILKDIVKWSAIIFVAAIFLYLIFPKYKFMGPNDCVVYKCNSITGEVFAYDFHNERWGKPNLKTFQTVVRLKVD